LDHTIADLVEADRLAHGDIDLKVRRTDVQALVNRIIVESEIGSEHEIVVHTEHLVVAVDPTRTEQIVAGLLRGALERSPVGSAIEPAEDGQEGVSEVEIVVAVDQPEAPEEVDAGWPDSAAKLLVQELQQLARDE